MFNISNLRIGTKLSVMSGLAIVCLAVMAAQTNINSSSVLDLSSASQKQSERSVDILRSRVGFRGVRVAALEAALATTDERLEVAKKDIETQNKSSISLAKAAIEKTSNPDEIQKTKKIIEEMDENAALSRQVVQIKAAELKLATNAEDINSGQRAGLRAQISTILDGRMVALSDEVAKQFDELRDAALREQNHVALLTESTMENGRLVSNVTSAIAILILIGSAAGGIFMIARPLRALVAPLTSIAKGDFTVKIPNADRRDEVGQIADAVQKMANQVGQTIAAIKASGREVTNASAEITTSTTDLSQRTEEQAASLEETSASMEQLAATVRRNAENAQMANQDAAETREIADRGGAVVAKAVGAMAKIEESSRKISDIIGVIDEIARQTNLLALNAAVEAARAGEAGRGFAVVASEVRSLAQRSSQAAKDIKDLITNSNGQVKDGVGLVNKAGESLTEIVESIKKVAAVVSDIANASTEQATGIDQINKALSQMDEVTQQNSALVEENAATAKTLESQARAMDERVAAFQIDGDHHATTQTIAKPSAPMHAAPLAAGRSTKAVAKPAEGQARAMQAQLKTAVGQEWSEF